NKLEGKGMTMEMLANNLSNFLGSPTLDRTEVQGFYDLSFDLAPEDFGIMMARAAANRGVQMPPEIMTEIAASTNPSFVSALDKVGLKLEKAKTPLPVIVVDDAKKTPTSN